MRGVVGYVKENVAHGIREGLPPGVLVSNHGLQIHGLQDLQRIVEIGVVNACTLLQSMLLLYAKGLQLEYPGIPNLVCVQHVVEQGETPLGEVRLVLPEFFNQLLVEVMMVRKDVLE